MCIFCFSRLPHRVSVCVRRDDRRGQDLDAAVRHQRPGLVFRVRRDCRLHGRVLLYSHGGLHPDEKVRDEATGRRRRPHEERTHKHFHGAQDLARIRPTYN